MKKCFVVYNHQSGRKKGPQNIEQIYRILEKYGYETTFIYTRYKQHAEDIVYEIDEADLVISAGGDGTFNEVMTGNLRRKKQLLIANLPLGTTNDVGHMYGYKKNLLKNLELLLNGTVKGVDVCTINNQIFTYVAGFGNFVSIAYDTPRRLKKKFGKLGYIIYGLNAVRDALKFFDVKYKIGNTEYTGKYSLLFVTNSNHIAGVNDIYENVKLNDQKFEIVFCNLTSKRELVKGLCMLSIKHIDQIPGFTFYQANELDIVMDNTKGISWCIDGEKLESDSKKFSFKIVEDVKVLVPSTNAETLFIKK
ncbi:MAG: YegS/Rv2252/BmrU family lipid kinase [Bacilli bacterium]|nr:YegS/Rv2252/BmrU family lipid kinase [Bacilli bacterium]